MKSVIFLVLIILGIPLQAREFHVSVQGNDRYAGTEDAPFRTIGKAVEYAYPGDIITVHAGTYREWVNPVRGGSSADNRIVFRAAPGEQVRIKGSERITDWQKVDSLKGVWKVVIPNSFFGSYNPYQDPIEGDWFHNWGRVHHTGEVYLNEVALFEVETLEKVAHPVPGEQALYPERSLYTWYCEQQGDNTVIWANFKSYNPNKELVEINVRPTCFYPTTPGLNYITVQGFDISQAATQWAAPSAEQIGALGTHWNKGWIIENNTVSNSRCVGITLGKERKSGHNVWSKDPSIDGSIHYIEVVFRAIRNGWNRDQIGNHIVRNNVIFACEEAGICGSMGASFSVIENNHVYDIYTKRQFFGYEIGGLKFHGAVDTEIRHNRVHRSGRALWLDWLTQGTRVSRNLFYDNDWQDIYMEVNHGPYIIDNNILGSMVNLQDQSHGGAYIQNLFLGRVYRMEEHARYTPYLFPHSTDVAGFSIIVGGDTRYLNNAFLPQCDSIKEQERGYYGLSAYNQTAYPVLIQQNLYASGALPYAQETDKAVVQGRQSICIREEKDHVYLDVDVQGMEGLTRKRVHSEQLGRTKLSKQHYEDKQGAFIDFNEDYFGNKRGQLTAPGAVAAWFDGKNSYRIW